MQLLVLYSDRKIPSDTCRSGSALSRLCHGRAHRFSLKSMCLLPPGPLRCVSAPFQLRQSRALHRGYAGLLFWAMLEHNAVFQQNSEQSRQEVMHRNNNNNNNITTNNPTSTKISKKRQIQALSLFLLMRILCDVVFITHT